MQVLTVDLNPEMERAFKQSKKNLVDIKFSLKPFIDFITQRIKRETKAKSLFYKYFIDQFNEYPELYDPIRPEDAKKYAPIFELIYSTVSPILSDEQEQLWALSQPVSPYFYFGTNAFYDFLVESGTCEIKSHLKMPSPGEMNESMMVTFYDLILQKYYGIPLNTVLVTIKSIVDPKTNLLKYYRLNVDTRFIDIKSRFDFKSVTADKIIECINAEQNTVSLLKELIPPGEFSIEGMSVVTLADVTQEYALDAVKNVIVQHHECSIGCHGDNISAALKTLVGSDEVEFSLLPYIQLNGKMIMHDHSGFQSVLIQVAKKENVDYQSLMDEYIKHPRKLIFTDLSEIAQQHFPLLKFLKENGIQSYAVLPLYYNEKLVGCLELYSKVPDVLDNLVLNKIDTAVVLLAQLFQNIIIEFNYEIVSVITGKFTSIQPAVQWRFYEAAYRYISSGAQERNLPVEAIDFKNVHPFYGAIDIKNSSIQRNLVIRKDLYLHFEVLEKTLLGIKENVAVDVQDEIPEHAKIWGYKEFEELSDREILKIEDYLLRQLPPYLNLLKEAHPEVSDLITTYFEYTALNGPTYENRSKYEKSMKKINRAVAIKLDEFNEELQDLYPCYFEKFRTDGVEFDVYLGQSITPSIPMPAGILQLFRFKQLELLANLARVTHQLIPGMALKLETTQLIFVYEKLIDISFRVDEQRFDVEGGYNIRYQMVKKRIDKAHIKNSHERLTQTGKIAIVYFNSWEAQEYLGYIKKLQQQNLLEEEVEYIEIEELQGVEGLKALRVTVKVEAA